jgi:hypothetical protein
MGNNHKKLLERFGEPIGALAGTSMIGVRDEREDLDICPDCGMLPIGGQCGCQKKEPCSACSMMPANVNSGCECNISEGKKKKGPSKKTARKILRGTKTFKQKMKKVEKWADNPAAAAAWMQHRATGEWPSKDD